MKNNETSKLLLVVDTLKFNSEALAIIGFSGSIIFELISLFVFLLKTFQD